MTITILNSDAVRRDLPYSRALYPLRGHLRVHWGRAQLRRPYFFDKEQHHDF